MPKNAVIVSRFVSKNVRMRSAPSTVDISGSVRVIFASFVTALRRAYVIGLRSAFAFSTCYTYSGPWFLICPLTVIATLQKSIFSNSSLIC